MSVVNGWRLFAYAEFLDRVERLAEAVERERARDPEGYARAANFRLLSAVRKLIFETIPANPALPAFRQGGTLGASRKHWFRAKFGGQRFRLFFRFDSPAKIIIYAWVNDAQTLRTYGPKTDAYAVFKAMLDRGRPPDDWAALLAEATSMDIEKPG